MIIPGVINTNTEQKALGERSYTFISDTVNYGTVGGGSFYAIQVIEACKFSSLTDAGRTDSSGPKMADPDVNNAVEIPPGIVLHGRFSNVKLHYGVVIAFE